MSYSTSKFIMSLHNISVSSFRQSQSFSLHRECTELLVASTVTKINCVSSLRVSKEFCNLQIQFPASTVNLIKITMYSRRVNSALCRSSDLTHLNGLTKCPRSCVPCYALSTLIELQRSASSVVFT